VQQALIYAMQKEQEARRFYTRLALGMPDDKLAKLFHDLAVMEGQHKAKLEDLYEEHFLREA
jgi:rubrerythrin